MRYFKSLIITATFSFGVHAAKEEQKFDLTQFQSAAEKAVTQAKAKGWLKDIDNPKLNEQDILLAKQLADQAVAVSKDTISRAANQLPNAKERLDLLKESDGALFVSFSMPRRALVDAFKVAHEHNLTILFRGIQKGSTNIATTMKLIQTLSAASGVEPNVGINPLRFTEFNVKSVPTMVIRDSTKFIVAPGTLNAEYVKEQFAKKVEDSHLDPLGQLFDIAEPDMVEQMKAAAKKIDWKAKQRLAKERFWKKYKTYTLPTSTENKQWLIDATVRVTKDIKNGQGHLLASAGKVTNPLKEFPLQLTVLVIDPYVENQVEWVKNEMKSVKGQFQIHLTHLDKNNGWNDLSKFRSAFGAPVFILPKQAIDKFKLQATPSKVQTQSNGYLLIKQFDWSEHL